MKQCILTLFTCLLMGCASNQFVETTTQTAKTNVEARERSLPDDLKTGNGNADDMKKGVKHATNEGLLKALLSIFK
ncbi:hypothetical protein LP316_14225 [Thalassotalea sp. LPB0316]|uniref:hypothetical protein n=1 Tax=Thalassotalea sp. LPB0316 TaxID=2769490 RepID=UPI00186638E5|nr:hypothetical protein [Thalassotalea sp. LPB0316]QOL25436.1 hypothetical protein LP316_14225 [Thalassotalea sp. LPB0316]